YCARGPALAPPPALATGGGAVGPRGARLGRFGMAAGNALVSLDIEIRRVFEWLEGQTLFWRKEIHRREEAVVRARGELLHRREMGKGGRGAGATGQEGALEEALQGLHQAHDRLDNRPPRAPAPPPEGGGATAPARPAL